MLYTAHAEHGVVWQNRDTFFGYSGWPTVCRADNGVLYVSASAFRAAHICPFGKTALFRSFDNGRTWSIPMVVNDTALDDRDSGILSLGGKKLLISWFCHPTELYLDKYKERIIHDWYGSKGLLDMYPTLPPEENHGGSYIRISRDGGMTFGEPRRVPVTAPHGPTLLKDGSLLYFGRQMRASDVASDPNWEIAAYRSTDEGESWELLAVIPTPADQGTFCEPHALQLPDGRILGAVRASGAAAYHGFTMYTTYSDDGGRTWTPIQHLDVSGAPPHLMLHSSGAVILSFGRREEPYGERALISYDGGETWEDEYIIRDAFSTDLGYPASVELNDGSILTVYYQKPDESTPPSILYSRWTLGK